MTTTMRETRDMLTLALQVLDDEQHSTEERLRQVHALLHTILVGQTRSVVTRTALDDDPMLQAVMQRLGDPNAVYVRANPDGTPSMEVVASEPDEVALDADDLRALGF